MRYLIIAILLSLHCGTSLAQECVSEKLRTKKNTVFVEIAGRGYFSLNYERAFGQANRVSAGFGWNHHETYIDSLEAIDKQVATDYDFSPYLSFYSQYSRLFGKDRHHFELGAGVVLTFLDMERWEFSNKLYETESFLSVYPIIGYRFEGYNGFLFMFTFNPLIQIPQGYFWPIPGVSFGYRF